MHIPEKTRLPFQSPHESNDNSIANAGYYYTNKDALSKISRDNSLLQYAYQKEQQLMESQHNGNKEDSHTQREKRIKINEEVLKTVFVDPDIDMAELMLPFHVQREREYAARRLEQDEQDQINKEKDPSLGTVKYQKEITPFIVDSFEKLALDSYAVESLRKRGITQPSQVCFFCVCVFFCFFVFLFCYCCYWCCLVL